MGRYIFNIIVATDLWLAAWCGCRRNETLSAAAYSTSQDGKFWGRFWKPVIDLLLGWYQHEHCRLQYEIEQKWNRGFND